MRTMTATEASRGFSALLDEAEHGETIVITRGGQRIAEIRPANTGNGNALREFAREWDAEHGSDPEGAREALEEIDSLNDLLVDDSDRWGE